MKRGKRGYFLLLFFILIISINTFADDTTCQYLVNNPYTKNANLFYQGNTYLGDDTLEIRNVRQGNSTSPMEFKVYNNYYLDVNVTIRYMFNGQQQSVQVIIPFDEYVLVNGSSSPGLDEDSINFIIMTSNLEAKFLPITFENLSCKECPNGTGILCLNDGMPCNISSECGGNYCLDGYCSNSSTCFNQDCKCESNEVQCPDNTGCVNKSYVQLGLKPICSAEECVSGYIDSETGNCITREGWVCNVSSDCESNSCVRNICSSSSSIGTCYNNDCKCAEDEVQCLDNTKCVKKDFIGIGNKPLCMEEECKKETYCPLFFKSNKCISYSYLNNATGLCDVYPEISKLRSKRLISIIFGFLALFLVIFTLIKGCGITKNIFKGKEKVNEEAQMKEEEIEDDAKNKADVIEEEANNTKEIPKESEEKDVLATEIEKLNREMGNLAEKQKKKNKV